MPFSWFCMGRGWRGSMRQGEPLGRPTAGTTKDFTIELGSRNGFIRVSVYSPLLMFPSKGTDIYQCNTLDLLPHPKCSWVGRMRYWIDTFGAGRGMLGSMPFLCPPLGDLATWVTPSWLNLNSNMQEENRSSIMVGIRSCYYCYCFPFVLVSFPSFFSLSGGSSQQNLRHYLRSAFPRLSI